MPDSTASLRHLAYAVLVLASLGSMTGRVLTVSDDYWRTPFLSANDRSRWCAIRALVEEGTFAIDNVTREPGWHTIDKVGHYGADGKFHFYSSKPPFLSLLLAGEYWVLRSVTGITLAEHPYYMGRLMLLVTNVLPIAFSLVLLAALAERYGTTDYGRILVVAAAALGTMVTTFAVTLNNHVLAAVCTTLLLYLVLPLWLDDDRAWWRLALLGLLAGLLVACELPALALTAALTAALLWRAPWPTLAAYLPPLLLVGAAMIGTNLLAHGSWRPPYAHRNDGAEIAQTRDLDPAALDRRELLPPLVDTLQKRLDIPIAPSARVVVWRKGKRWELRDDEHARKFAIVALDDGALSLRHWDNWYEYDGSYWAGEGDRGPRGVDRGEPSVANYALHSLVGHHGIFSLTPIWLLTVVGLALLLADREHPLRDVAWLTLAVTLVCLAFYLFVVPARDRNYGGLTCGLRWVFWLAPLWLATMLPAADALDRDPWRRGAGLTLLGFSIASANFAALNPWKHPWIYQYAQYMGWLLE